MFHQGIYISACPEISHCLETQCTRLEDNKCVKCDGEVKDTPYWAAYTRRPSVNKRCESKELIDYDVIFIEHLLSRRYNLAR